MSVRRIKDLEAEVTDLQRKKKKNVELLQVGDNQLVVKLDAKLTRATEEVRR